MLVLVALVLGAGPVATAAAAHPESGPGVVLGTVRDTDGRPVAGAWAEVTTETYDASDGSQRVHTRSAVADAAGAFRIEGIVLPGQTLGDTSRGFVVRKDGYVDEGVGTVEGRLMAWTGEPVRVDVVLRRRDVVLRGRLNVRDGGSPVGGRVGASPVLPAGQHPGRFDHWQTTADDDGRWELRVPAGAYRVWAQSTYGLPASWPDLGSPRVGAVTRAATGGETVDGLDISMRLRMRDAAVDEFGNVHPGWSGDQDAAVGRYPRDPYRSVTVERGAQVAAAAARHARDTIFPRLPQDELITITGFGPAVDVPVTNTGDDVLWTGAVRIEGTFEGGSRCEEGVTRRPCSDRWILPGDTVVMRVTPSNRVYAPTYDMTLVVPTNAGADLRVPFRLRNVADPALGPDDVNTMAALLPYLSPEAERSAILLGAPGPWQQRRPTGGTPTGGGPPASAVTPATPRIGAVVLRRRSVRTTFPAAGRIDVRIDRRVPARGRSRARWSTTRSVGLRATRPGVRTARLRTLPRGRYRVRVTARFGAAKVQRATAVRTVHR